jgi:hypothetical protein
MRKLIILTALLVGILINLQASEVKPYEWEKDRKRTSLSESDRKFSELILRQHIQYNFTFENNQFILYTTTHFIIWVNNNEAVEKNNKIRIPMNGTIDLSALKARSINKDGKVTQFDLSNLKEMKNEESGNSYRIFAMEGVELDSEIEYYYTKKMNSDIFERIFTQFNSPLKISSFLLTSPKHLKFDFRSYYGAPEIKQNTDNKEMNEYAGSARDIPAIKSEPFSFYDANRQRIEFKLAYNSDRSAARLYTWEDAAKNFYKVLSETTKKDDKALGQFIKTLKDDSNQELSVRIKNIEAKIKTTIQVESNQYDADLTAPENVIERKVASSQGITKLFFLTFKKLNIICHPVITCSRERRKFDGTFDTWGYLDEFILYFPETQRFLAPSFFEARYPIIPTEFTSQHGLFIEPFQVGAVSSALSTIDFIPATNYELNVDNLKIDVSFSDDLEFNQVNQMREFGGYSALQFLTYYDFLNKEQQTTLIEELIKETAPDGQIKSWKCTPITQPETYIFKTEVGYQTSHFIEKAGNRLLFKVGQLIGPQTELYRDTERTNAVENAYKRGYHREIKVIIPAGYTIKNPQDLKIDVTYQDGDKTPFLFQSDYKLDGQNLSVFVLEFYKEIYAPLEKYEDFRKVINAAADFNKITLVLEKK